MTSTSSKSPQISRSFIYGALAALFLAILAIFFFFPDDIQGRVLQQHDIMQGIANGQEAKAYHEATGETTRWTNSLFGGMPNFQIAPSYPANDMLAWIGNAFQLWLPAPANLLFAMMFGFFIFCLALKLKWPDALFGAIAWGLSSYFIIIIGAGHIWKFITLAYIPPTIAGIVLLYRGKYLSGTALAALFGALQLQSNHPQMSYYFLFVIFAMVIAWLCDAVKKHTVKQWGIATVCALCAGTIAVAANAPGLYNSYEYSKETIRGKATELTVEGQKPAAGLDREYITAWSYGIDESFSLLIPNVKGGATIKPVAGENQLMSLADTKPVQNSMLSPEEIQFLGQFPQYFGDQPMTNGPVYAGAFILLLAIVALLIVDGPMKWALFAVSVVALFLSWGHNFQWFTDLFIDYFPGYNKFRTVSSILVIVEFTIPLLAVMALHKMFSTENFLKRYGTTFYAVIGIGAAICLLGWISPSIFGSPFSASETQQLTEYGLMTNPQYSGILQMMREARLSLVSADSARSLLFILLGFGVCMLHFKGVLKNRTATVCILSALILIDLFTIDKRYVNTENFTEPLAADAQFSKTKADEAILRDTSNYRVLDVKDFNGARSSYFHKTVGGYHAAKLTRYNDLIENQIVKNNPGVINMLNAKYILNGDTYEQNLGALGNAWWIGRLNYVNSADKEMHALDSLNTAADAVADVKFRNILGSASPKTPGDTIYETSYAPNRLTYKAKTAKGGVAVFSEIYFPWGWEAEIDGKPVEIGRVNYVLRALRVPAGNHDITFTFDPKSSKVTNAAGISAVIVIYLLCIAALVMLYKRMAGKPKE
ncbi:MAG: YfhO family protein [Prevotella sp.]|nr:YfhO family protein [Bacteroides sp.]MCM1366552.1 YfhO family protein [Prevotella sp.]MCM1436862.1 YfhO family protein [Prevotella sp.]